MKYLVLILAVSLAACKHAPAIIPDQPVQEVPQEIEAPKETLYQADWDHIPNGKAWTQMVIDSLDSYGQGLMSASAPKDSEAFCQNFKKLDHNGRKQFYVMLISAMAKRESGFKPETSYTESFKGSDGKYIVSRGLLQISQSSSNQSAYKCGTTKADMLYDPKFNLTCGVKILNYWAKDNYIGGTSSNSKLGGGRYWSVMRPGNSQNYIKNKTNQLPICKGN